MLSNSGMDENGRFSGGTAGDNTGKEWNIVNWYSYPWNCVIRHSNPEIRAKIANLATKAAKNNNIGYDQNQRDTFWKELKKVNYDPSKIKTKCESDCSAGVIAITKATGYLLKNNTLKNISATYTGNMRSAYKKAGFTILTDSKYLNSDEYLLEGDILLNDENHTAINLTNGKKANAPLTVTKTACLYTHAYKDIYGKTSVSKCIVKKGTKVTFIKHDGYGWVYVKLPNDKTGWIVASRLAGKSIPGYRRTKLNSTIKAYPKPDTRLKSINIKKGKIIPIICRIEKGTKKGWYVISYNNKEYYTKF